MYTHQFWRTLRVSEPSHLSSQHCAAMPLPGLGCCLLCCGGSQCCLSLLILSPRVPNIHLTMFTENYFVHRLFQARALHPPRVALVCVSRQCVH